MKKALLIIVTLTMVMGIPLFAAYAGDWKSSPNNWDNSPNNWKNSRNNPENSRNNWKNSSNNWENSPNNWNNSPNKPGNDRIILDKDGKPKGYAVPKENGSATVYDFTGDRRGYKLEDK